jgi:hypothetical protein
MFTVVSVSTLQSPSVGGPPVPSRGLSQAVLVVLSKEQHDEYSADFAPLEDGVAEVRHESSPEQALRTIQADPPGLVIVGMTEEMDGLEFLALLTRMTPPFSGKIAILPEKRDPFPPMIHSYDAATGRSATVESTLAGVLDLARSLSTLRGSETTAGPHSDAFGTVPPPRILKDDPSRAPAGSRKDAERSPAPVPSPPRPSAGAAPTSRRTDSPSPRPVPAEPTGPDALASPTSPITALPVVVLDKPTPPERTAAISRAPRVTGGLNARTGATRVLTTAAPASHSFRSPSAPSRLDAPRPRSPAAAPLAPVVSPSADVPPAAVTSSSGLAPAALAPSPSADAPPAAVAPSPSPDVPPAAVAPSHMAVLPAAVAPPLVDVPPATGPPPNDAPPSAIHPTSSSGAPTQPEPRAVDTALATGGPMPAAGGRLNPQRASEGIRILRLSVARFLPIAVTWMRQARSHVGALPRGTFLILVSAVLLVLVAAAHFISGPTVEESRRPDAEAENTRPPATAKPSPRQKASGRP